MIRKRLKFKPNLKNHKRTTKNFSWKNYSNELDWFKAGKINAAYQAVTRHALSEHKDKVALYWEGEKKSKQFTFLDIEKLSNQFANLLKKKWS